MPFLKYLVNEYCAEGQSVAVNKHESLPNSNFIPSSTATGSCQSSFDPYDLSSNDEENSTANNVAEATPGPSNCAARLLTSTRLHLNSLPGAPKN